MKLTDLSKKAINYLKDAGDNLLAASSDIPEIKIDSKLPDDMTLGDVVQLKTKKKKDE